MDQGKAHTLLLQNFEGTIDFLLFLTQQRELDIYEVDIQKVANQFFEFLAEESWRDINAGADFLAQTASLLLIKSKRLLPVEVEEEVVETGPNFELLHKLIEYRRFKEIASALNERQGSEEGYYSRGAEEPVPERAGMKWDGLRQVSLADLSTQLEGLMARAAARHGGEISEEVWRVADKVKWIKSLVVNSEPVPLERVLIPEWCKGELIVTFLALLELMKLGAVQVLCDDHSTIFVAEGE